MSADRRPIVPRRSIRQPRTAALSYSFLRIVREALRGDTGWRRAWRDPEPKPHYDAVVVDGGGHGLATAYYLAKEHGLTNVAVLEKSWIGSGNAGRNTTIIRSNYLLPGNEPFYEHSFEVWEGLEQDLNFNTMVSQRGVPNLFHSDAARRPGAVGCRGVGLCPRRGPAGRRYTAELRSDRDPHCRRAGDVREEGLHRARPGAASGAAGGGVSDPGRAASRGLLGPVLAAMARQELGATLPAPEKWTAAGDLTFICTTPGQWPVVQARDDGTLPVQLAAAVGIAAC